jgi:hypothetical protein
MTSAIVFNTIDTTFPVAGQDNDSQGFRDNFSLIQTALATAQSEISTLQSNSLDKTQNQTLNGNVLDTGVLKFVGTLSNTVVATVNTLSNINAADYTYRKFLLNADTSFKIDQWPVPATTTGNLGSFYEITLELTVSSTSKKAYFQLGSVNSSLGNVTSILHLGSAFGGQTYLTVIPSSTTLVKVFSPDGGINVFVRVVDTFVVAS